MESSDSFPTFEQVLSRYAAAENKDGTDKTVSHSYGPLYTALFRSRRTSCENVLEIGVYSGASVMAFADYFSNATVWGLDIDMGPIKFGRGHPRIRYVNADGTNEETPSLIGANRFDVILDDASHTIRDQIKAFEVWAPVLAPGGLYIIEDILESNFSAVHEGILRVVRKHPHLSFPPTVYDTRHVKGQPDDIVIVVEAISEEIAKPK